MAINQQTGCIKIWEGKMTIISQYEIEIETSWAPDGLAGWHYIWILFHTKRQADLWLHQMCLLAA